MAHGLSGFPFLHSFTNTKATPTLANKPIKPKKPRKSRATGAAAKRKAAGEAKKAGLKAGMEKRKHHHADNAEVQRRVQLVYKMIVDGMASYRIVQIIAENQTNADAGKPHDPDLIWNVNERQIRYYYKKAENLFAETQAMARESAFGRSLIRMNEIYRRALVKGDLQSAHRAELRLQELLGVDGEQAAGTGADEPTTIILPSGKQIMI